MAQKVLYDSGTGNIYLVGSDVATVNITNGMTLATTFNPNTFTFADNYLYTDDYILTADTTIQFPTTSLVGGTQVSFTLVVNSGNTFKLNFTSQYTDIAGYNNNTVLNAGRYQVTMINEGSSKGIVNILEFISSGAGATPLSLVSAIASNDGLSIAVLFNQALTGTSNFTVSGATINGIQTISGSTVTIPISPAILNGATITISGGTTLTNSIGTAFAGVSGYTVTTSGIGGAVNPPTSVTLTNLTSSSVSLQWVASTTPSVMYQVYKGGVAVGSQQSGTTFTDTGLTANTAYVYTVQAFSGATGSTVTSGVLVAGVSQGSITTLGTNKSLQVTTYQNAPYSNVTLTGLGFVSNGTTDSDFSIAFDVFVNNSNVKINQVIFSLTTISNAILDIRIENPSSILNDNRVSIIVFDKVSGTRTKNYQAPISRNAWNKVVILFTGSTSSASIYINNSLATVTNTNAGVYNSMFDTSTSSLKLQIGNNPFFTDETVSAVNTLIDNVYFINKKLSAGEVSELYNGGTTKYGKTLTFNSNVVAYYLLNDSLNDLSGNNNNLTSDISVTYNTSVAS